MRAPIAITGLGAVSALGDGVEVIVQAMREGRDALTELERFDLRALAPVRLAGWVTHRRAEDAAASLDAWACDAAREAWRDARGDEAGFAPERIAIVSGTTLGERGALGLSVDAVAAALGAKGPRWTISTACASSANALGLARDLLLSGDADVVIAGGAEKLVIEIIAGFAALGVLGAGKCAPFGQDVGTTLGEGAGYLVLERSGEREMRPRAYLLGYGLSSDAFHETSPDPRGEGVARAMTGALVDAGIDAAHLDYVNAHATGTAANDDAEWRGIQRALGSRAAAIPVSASKGFFGHAQGAAGVLETIATIACMERGLVPPSLRVGRGRPRGPTDTVSETGRAREAGIEVAMSNSAAFGGANAVVAVGRHALSGPALAARPVTIDGVGSIAVAAGVPRDEAAIAHACGEVELRGTDPSSRFVLAACTHALAEAGVALRGATRERTGIFGGVGAPPRESVRSYQRSLERGIDRASAPAFARTVAHAPVGAASRLLGAKGPATTIVGDGVGGLLAIAYAARWLATRDDADRLLAGGVDERSLDETRDQPLDATDEGATFVLLASGGRGPRVLGVATSGSADDATARALAHAGVHAADVHAWIRSGHAEAAATLASARAAARAVSAIREGAPLAVALAEGRQGAVALVLARPRT